MIKRFLLSLIIFLLLFLSIKYIVKFGTLSDNNLLIAQSRSNAIINAINRVSDSVVGINVTQLKRKRSNSIWDPFYILILVCIK